MLFTLTFVHVWTGAGMRKKETGRRGRLEKELSDKKGK